MGLKRDLTRWERTVAGVAVSPWASLLLGVFGVCWIALEALRGKWIGWDGLLTLIALEVALATLRRT